LTWIFNAQDTTTTNNAALTISASIACLSCVTFVDGLPVAALPDPLSIHGFISAEGKLSEAFGCSLLKHFELLHCFHK
jgi:hypothetical protein